MAQEAAIGYPNFYQDGLDKRIETLFSTVYQEKFYNSSSLAEITNNTFSAKIKQHGEKVIIPSVPSITVRKHVVGGKMTMENPKSPAIEFPINRGNYFYFQLDKTSLVKMLNGEGFFNECTKDAGKQVDAFIGSEFMSAIVGTEDSHNSGATAGITSVLNLGVASSPLFLTPSNILKAVLRCQVALDEQNVSPDDWFMMLPPVAQAVLQYSDLKDISMVGGSESIINRGRIDKPIGRFKVYISNQLKTVDESGNTCYYIPFGRKSAIAFASQMTSMTYFDKFEDYEGQGMRGVNLYDWKTVSPVALGFMYATFDLGV